MQLALNFLALQALVASAVSAASLHTRQTNRVANDTTPVASISPSDPFPTNVGYPGTRKYGPPPFLAVTDRKEGQLSTSIDTRWTPIDAEPSCDFNIFEHLGNESPYFSSPIFSSFQQSHSVLPEGCTVEQVHILHRHGSRYPTSSTTEGAPYFGAVIANVSRLTNPSSNFSASGPLSFLNSWKYELGAEVLNAVGAQQLFDSGVHHYYQYGKLYNETHKPVIRTTSQQRILDSARYWTLGFFGWDAPSKYNLEIILEGGDGLGTAGAFNNTLASYDTCNNSDTITVGDTYLRPTWDAIYLPKPRDRLQQYVSGLELTNEMVYGMQSLCAYETVALGYSNFCGLFTKDEWEGFEYDLDLQFNGDYGIMSPNGKAQGIGWVNEFLDRLENATWNAATITTENSTLDSNPTYFPLNQSMYVDFTHDDIIVSVLTALNYTQVVGDFLDPTYADPSRTFVLSHITPFAARLVFEVVSCKGKRYVRTKLNEAVIPYSGAEGCPAGKALCPIESFVGFQKENAYKDANFNKACFGVNGTDFTVTGPVRNGTVY
ncbi:Histidine phosphatase superfamily, clade-2 [Kalmanozyma brasiliensis GHG001]|uniref:3-phytase A n=1 Tax=Kalmanozyma brasiliensis (strain GHG001) TaxID=1365824 RepID=V5GSN7_KALBG|nr:Histidine phosphatase superfamily, clade-2 [Kalmanozyma brasiliensis GHG001]EST08937.1 Histidine phosphatase superfamily, clade-2 [Kalmanozyma brasiliensis GHG001]